MNNKGTDQTLWMFRHVCAFVVPLKKKKQLSVYITLLHTQLMIFQQLIKTKMLKTEEAFNIYEQDKFLAQISIKKVLQPWVLLVMRPVFPMLLTYSGNNFLV